MWLYAGPCEAINLIGGSAQRQRMEAANGVSGCNRLWSVGAADGIGPVSRDAGEKSAGATPRLRSDLLPPPPGEKDGKRNMTKDPEDVPRGRGGEPRGWKRKGDRIGRVNRAFSRLDGQQRSSVWSCSGPLEGIDPIMVQIPMLADGKRK
jgi:hypothetical protein